MRPATESWPGRHVSSEQPAGKPQDPDPGPELPLEAEGTGFELGRWAEVYLAYLDSNQRCSPHTIVAYRSDYRKMQQLLTANGHDLDVRKIATADLEVCLAAVSDLSPATVQRIIHSLSSLFSWLCRRGITDQNPVVDVTRPRRAQTIPRHFTRDEADRLMAACETSQECVIVGLLRYCGLRRAELLHMKLSDVAADFSSVRIEGKGRRERAMPLHDCLKPLLQEHLRWLTTGDGALITNHTGKQMSATSFWRLFRRLLGRAGLSATGLTPHGLRHHFASELVRAGVDVATVAELLGHSNISVTSVYLHSDITAKRAAINSLPVVPAPAHRSASRNPAGTDTPLAYPSRPLQPGDSAGGAI